MFAFVARPSRPALVLENASAEDFPKAQLLPGEPEPIQNSEPLADLTPEQEDLFNRSLPQLRRMAERFHAKHCGRMDVEDLFQEGSRGLIHAIRRFEPGRAPFASYASMWMHCYMSRAFESQANIIRWPAHIFWDLYKKNTEADSAELAPLPATRKFVELRPDFANEEHPLTSEKPLNLLPERLGTLVADALTEREAEVISRRFGLDGYDPHTLEEVGMLFGVTRERIRQIEFVALKKLRHPARLRTLQAAIAA